MEVRLTGAGGTWQGNDMAARRTSGRVLEPLDEAPVGSLHVYLGAVPGAGKTHAMLAEGRRLAARGVDVAVGLVETHGREGFDEALAGLGVIPPQPIAYRGATFGELAVEAILARHPAVVLVDELAHTNTPGSAREKRWQDVDELLRAGIDVVTTLNVVHLAELHDAVEQITGISQREFVPEAVVLSASQIDFVDTDPRVVLRRLGKAASPGSDGRARSAFSDLDRLELLRRLARTWLSEHGLDGSTPLQASSGPVAGMAATPGPVVVALAPGAPARHAVRRAAELAEMRHAPLVGVSVRDSTGIGAALNQSSQHLERMLADFGGRYAEVGGTDIAWELARFAAREGAVTLVIGDTSHSRGHRLVHGSIARRTLRLAGAFEVYIVPPGPDRDSQKPAGTGWLRDRRSAALPPRRRAVSWLLAVAAPVALMAALSPLRVDIGLGGALICALLAVVAVALAGGIGTALLATAAAVVSADFFFAPPYYSLRVDHVVDVLALVVFAACGGLMGLLTEVLAVRARATARSQAQADRLARLLAEEVITQPTVSTELAAELRSAFDLESVAFLARDAEGWQVLAAAGGNPPARPDAASFAAEVAPGRFIALSGPAVTEPGRHLLGIFTAELLLARRRVQLASVAKNA